MKTANVTEKNGPIAGLTVVDGDEDIMLITDKGVMIRFGVQSVSQTGRATLGVRLIKVDDDSIVSTMAKIAEDETEDSEDTDNSDKTDDSTNDSSEENSTDSVDSDTSDSSDDSDSDNE